MRLMVGREESQGPTVYRVDGETAVNLTRADARIGTDLTAIIAAGHEDIARIAPTTTSPQIPVAEITPALPISAPPKILCLGLNYVDHVKEGGYDIPTYPAIFIRVPTSLVAAGGPLIKPQCSDKLDYEAELMVVIGKGGRHIGEDEALQHVFGYTA
ncbi:MAG: fumarylacetoacetate hydrolase family protein, partial [Alphaproteobacteria bacterium]